MYYRSKKKGGESVGYPGSGIHNRPHGMTLGGQGHWPFHMHFIRGAVKAWPGRGGDSDFIDSLWCRHLARGGFQLEARAKEWEKPKVVVPHQPRPKDFEWSSQEKLWGEGSVPWVLYPSKCSYTCPADLKNECLGSVAHKRSHWKKIMTKSSQLRNIIKENKSRLGRRAEVRDKSVLL